MPYSIGPLGQTDGNSFAFRVTMPDLTEAQFSFINKCIDEDASDTYPDVAARTMLVVIEPSKLEGHDPEEFRDYVGEQLIDRFVRRCCDPESPRFITEQEYEFLLAE